MIAALIGALACAIWIVLVAAWGRFWRVVTLPRGLQLRPGAAPRVAVIIPARNEADVIGRVISSLLAQDYPGPLRIFVVDDHSIDSTAAIVADAAKNAADRVTVVAAASLPAGWTGKMWALAQGVERAAVFSPEFFLFSDADIVHGPASLTSLVAMAQARSLDMVSLMVKLRCVSFAERTLMPAFVFFFFMLYPPEWVNDRGKGTAAAAGGDILVRAKALARIGGIATIRGELIDDCALAREIKPGGGIWLGLTDDVESVRTYDTFSNVGRMISRNAFYQLRHSVWLLAGTLLGLGITYVAPVILLFFGGWPAILGATAWLLMSISYWPMVQFYGLSVMWAFSLPAVAVLYAGATLHSAIGYWMNRGGEWKGRAQDRTR